MICYSFNIMIPNKLKSINKNSQGSPLLSPAHGRAGARTISLSLLLSVPPPSAKFAMFRLVGTTGFEPVISCSQSMHVAATPRPGKNQIVNLWLFY